MPEPQAREPRPAFRWADVLKPVRDANFVRFSLSIAVWFFSANILGPFVAPFITAPDGAGAPHTWLGIMMVIS